MAGCSVMELRQVTLCKATDSLVEEHMCNKGGKAPWSNADKMKEHNVNGH